MPLTLLLMQIFTADNILDEMKIKLLRTEKDYNQALSRLGEIFHAPVDSKEGDEAEILTILIEKYENKHFPIDAPVPSRLLNLEWSKRK